MITQTSAINPNPIETRSLTHRFKNKAVRKNIALMASDSFITPELQKTTEGKNKNAIPAAILYSGKIRAIVLVRYHAAKNDSREK